MEKEQKLFKQTMATEDTVMVDKQLLFNKNEVFLEVKLKLSKQIMVMEDNRLLLNKNEGHLVFSVKKLKLFKLMREFLLSQQR